MLCPRTPGVTDGCDRWERAMLFLKKGRPAGLTALQVYQVLRRRADGLGGLLAGNTPAS